jgi:hypothetical protein
MEGPADELLTQRTSQTASQLLYRGSRAAAAPGLADVDLSAGLRGLKERDRPLDDRRTPRVPAPEAGPERPRHQTRRPARSPRRSGELKDSNFLSSAANPQGPGRRSVRNPSPGDTDHAAFLSVVTMLLIPAGRPGGYRARSQASRSTWPRPPRRRGPAVAPFQNGPTHLEAPDECHLGRA